MTEEVKQAIQTHAHYYAMVYAREYVIKVEDVPVPFRMHYEQLAYDNDFFHSFIYENETCYAYMKQQRELLTEQTESAMEELLETLASELEVLYQAAYGAHYIDIIDEFIKDYKEELQFAKEDYVYYENRQYIGEEDQIGGPVSEEERMDMMHEMKRKQALYQERLTNLQQAKKDIFSFVPRIKTHA